MRLPPHRPHWELPKSPDRHSERAQPGPTTPPDAVSIPDGTQRHHGGLELPPGLAPRVVHRPIGIRLRALLSIDYVRNGGRRDYNRPGAVQGEIPMPDDPSTCIGAISHSSTIAIRVKVSWQVPSGVRSNLEHRPAPGQ